MVDTQIEIKNWFDKTYKSRGFNYLRPVNAYDIFATLLNPDEHKSHLDVACGPGLLLKAFEKTKVKSYGLDISTEAIIKCREFCPEATVQEGNAENLPYKDKTFDSISCIGSLERMIDRNAVLQEQKRVLKDAGELCFMVRNAENFTWKYLWKPLGLYNKKGHQDALNLEEWRALFVKNGFEIIKIYPDHWPYYRLIKTFFPWKKMNTAKIRKFPLSLNLAYEFIFHLKKK